MAGSLETVSSQVSPQVSPSGCTRRLLPGVGPDQPGAGEGDGAARGKISPKRARVRLRENGLWFAENLAGTASKLCLQNNSFEISIGLYMMHMPVMISKLNSSASRPRLSPDPRHPPHGTQRGNQQPLRTWHANGDSLGETRGCAHVAPTVNRRPLVRKTPAHRASSGVNSSVRVSPGCMSTAAQLVQ